MKQLSAKQFMVLSFLIIIAQKMFMLPSLLIGFSGRDSYLSIAIFIAIEIAILMLIMVCVRLSKQRTLYSLLAHAKILGKIILAVALIFLFFKLMLLFGELKVFFNNSLSEPLSEWLALAPLCFILFLTGTKSLRGIGRFAEILVVFIVAAMVILVILVATNVDFSLLCPFLEQDLTPTLKNVYYFPMWFGDLSLLIIAIGEVDLSGKAGIKSPCKKHFLKLGGLTALVGGIFALFFCTALFAVYGDLPDLIDYSHNISNMLLYSSSSYIYGRFDVPIFCIWIFSILVQLCLVFYSLTRHISFVAGYKNNKVISLIVALCAYFGFAIFFKSDYVLIALSVSWLRFFALYNSIALPLLLFFISLKLRHKPLLLKKEAIK